MKLHLDTDLGSNVDDLAALVMLLGSDEVELTGVTTSIDPGGPLLPHPAPPDRPCACCPRASAPERRRHPSRSRSDM
ncbi:MAG: hypothetical protein ACR2HV_02100 [Acidimicrobiales bacterium]